MAGKATRSAILARIGGTPKQVDSELSRFRKSAEAFSSSRPRFIDKYPKKWIAVYNGKVVASGSTSEAVLKALDKKKIAREHTVVRFIEKNQRTLIL